MDSNINVNQGSFFNHETALSEYGKAQQSIETLKAQGKEAVSSVQIQDALTSSLDGVVLKALEDVAELSPYTPKLVTPNDVNDKKVSELINEVQLTLRDTSKASNTGRIVKNGWFSPNPAVLFRMTFFAVMASLQLAKSLEKKLDIQQMNMVWDLGQTSAALIMHSAKLQALQHILAGTMQAVNATVQFALTAASFSATNKANKEYDQALGNKQHKLDKANQKANAAEPDVIDQANKRNHYDDAMAEHNHNLKAKKQELERVENEMEQVDAGRADVQTRRAELRQEHDRLQAELDQIKADKPIKEDYGIDPAFDTRAKKVQKLQEKAEKAQLELDDFKANKSQFIGKIVESKISTMHIFSQGMSSATKSIESFGTAAITLLKGIVDAMREVVQASQKIAEKMMHSAAEAFQKESEAIIRLLDQLTQMIKANIEAHKMNVR